MSWDPHSMRPRLCAISLLGVRATLVAMSSVPKKSPQVSRSILLMYFYMTAASRFGAFAVLPDIHVVETASDVPVLCFLPVWPVNGGPLSYLMRAVVLIFHVLVESDIKCLQHSALRLIFTLSGSASRGAQCITFLKQYENRSLSVSKKVSRTIQCTSWVQILR